MSTGVNMGRPGTLAYSLLFMLSLVTGNLARVGKTSFEPLSNQAFRAGIPVQIEPV